MNTPFDKSVQEVCCRPEDEQNHDDCVSQKGPLAPASELELRPADDAASTAKRHFRPQRIPPRRLALCGGGIRCIAHVGVFKGLAKEGMLSCVREMLGISAGALFALVYVCGYSLHDIERLALEFDFSLLRNIELENIFLFPTQFGLDNGAALDKFISSLLHRSGLSPEITFSELQKARPIAFRCFATDIQTAKVREFSAQTTPNVKVRIAVRASMSLPILYTPVEDPLTGRLLMDGGVLHNLPIVFQNPAERAETLAVLFMKGGDFVEEGGKLGLAEVFQQTYDAMTVMRNEPYLKAFHENIIRVSARGISTIHFEQEREKREALIQSALEDTMAFLGTSSRIPRRRVSVS